MSKLILAVDGGGIRGAASAHFLTRVDQALTERYQTSLRDHIDLYAGTSTGSLISLSLATSNMSMADISELYEHQIASEIFAENKGGLFDVDGVNTPRFQAEGKTHVLKRELGEAKIGDVPDGKACLAIAYGIEKRRPMVFKSSHPKHHNLYSRDVADASSAAPTFFPTKELDLDDDIGWLIDGGVVANNPTMCAIAEARRIWNVTMANVRVLSIGTGYQVRKINGYQSQKWGALQWLTKGNLIDIMGDQRIVAYQAMAITDPSNYIRVNAEMKVQPGLPVAPDDSMDDISPSNIKKLRAFGDFWFEQYGEATIKLLRGDYNGPSLDHIDACTGKPIEI